MKRASHRVICRKIGDNNEHKEKTQCKQHSKLDFYIHFLASAITTIFNYIDLKNPTIQVTAVFIAEIIIIVVFMLAMLLDAIQKELYDINNSLYDIKDSLDDLYDFKQINSLRSTKERMNI